MFRLIMALVNNMIVITEFLSSEDARVTCSNNCNLLLIVYNNDYCWY